MSWSGESGRHREARLKSLRKKYPQGKIVEYEGKEYYLSKSPRKNKQKMSTNLETGDKVHYGDPSMREYPGTKRGDNYCTRSKGIGNTKNPESANFWSRKDLWNCKGKKSMKKKVI